MGETINDLRWYAKERPASYDVCREKNRWATTGQLAFYEVLSSNCPVCAGMQWVIGFWDTRLHVEFACGNNKCGHLAELYPEEVERHFRPLVARAFVDVADLDIEDCTKLEWLKVLIAIGSGSITRLHRSAFNYYLEVLPPKMMQDNWFVFLEGGGDPTLFWTPRAGGAFYCKSFSRNEIGYRLEGMEAAAEALTRMHNETNEFLGIRGSVVVRDEEGGVSSTMTGIVQRTSPGRYKVTAYMGGATYFSIGDVAAVASPYEEQPAIFLKEHPAGPADPAQEYTRAVSGLFGAVTRAGVSTGELWAYSQVAHIGGKLTIVARDDGPKIVNQPINLHVFPRHSENKRQLAIIFYYFAQPHYCWVTIGENAEWLF